MVDDLRPELGLYGHKQVSDVLNQLQRGAVGENMVPQAISTEPITNHVKRKLIKWCMAASMRHKGAHQPLKKNEMDGYGNFSPFQ